MTKEYKFQIYRKKIRESMRSLVEVTVKNNLNVEIMKTQNSQQQQQQKLIYS